MCTVTRVPLGTLWGGLEGVNSHITVGEMEPRRICQAALAELGSNQARSTEWN